jgi:hypothetical protein
MFSPTSATTTAGSAQAPGGAGWFGSGSAMTTCNEALQVWPSSSVTVRTTGKTPAAA